MEEKKISMRNHIWSLVKVQLLQYRIYYIIIISVYLFIVLYSMCVGMGEVYAGWRIQAINSMKFMVMLTILVYALLNYNIVSRDSISMYPGTIRSRLISRLLADHIVMIGLVLTIAGLYLVQGLMIQIFGRMYDWFLVGSAWNGWYVWYGSLVYLGYFFMAYSAFALWFSLLARFHKILVYGSGLIIVVVCAFFCTHGYQSFFQKIIDTVLAKEGSIGHFLTISLGIWAVCILLTFLVAGSVAAWRRQERVHLVLGSVICYIATVLIIIGTNLFSRGGSTSFSAAEFYKRTNHHVEEVLDIRGIPRQQLVDVVSFVPVRWENGGESDGFCMSVYCSVSEAKEIGLHFNESAVDKDHMVELVGTEGGVIQGKDILVPFLEQYHESVSLKYDPEEEKGFFQVSGQARSVGVNSFYGDIWRFVPDTSFDMEYEEDIFPYLRQVIIYSDEYRSLFVDE